MDRDFSVIAIYLRSKVKENPKKGIFSGLFPDLKKIWDPTIFEPSLKIFPWRFLRFPPSKLGKDT